MSTSSSPAPHIRLQPPSRWGGLRAHELWEHRELAYFLAKRDLQVRYKQTALGAVWALAQPVALTLIFAIVMGRVVSIASEEVPYWLLALSGVTVWMFVSSAINTGALSLVSDANLLSKVYFPRLLLPLTKVAALIVDLVVAQLLLIAVALVTGHLVGIQIVALPLFLALAVFAVVAIAIIGSALNVRYRDTVVFLPLFVLVGLFLTPVAYPASLVGDGVWQTIYALNPFATAITGVRWAVLGTPLPAMSAIAISVGVTLILLVVGVISFRRTEVHVADVI